MSGTIPGMHGTQEAIYSYYSIYLTIIFYTAWEELEHVAVGRWGWFRFVPSGELLVSWPCMGEWEGLIRGSGLPATASTKLSSGCKRWRGCVMFTTIHHRAFIRF